MSNIFCVNKSGGSVPIYSDTSGTTQIGSLYNREACGYNQNWGGDDYYCNVVFRNSSGNVVGGFIINPPNYALMGCHYYPYGTQIINGTSYYTFYMRSARNIYDVGGNYWGTVAAGRRVACLSSLSGDSHPEWKAINYVEKSSGGWQQVSGSGSQYGFVDAGLSVASGWNLIPMYGNW